MNKMLMFGVIAWLVLGVSGSWIDGMTLSDMLGCFILAELNYMQLKNK